MRKQFIIISLLIVSLSTTLVGQKNNVIIEGKIIGYDGKKDVKYSIGSVSNGMDIKSVKPDSLGRFVITKYIDEPQFFNFYGTFNGKYHICKMVLRPNNHYSFISEGQVDADWKIPYSPDIYYLEQNSDDGRKIYKYDQGQVAYNKIQNQLHGPILNGDWDLNKPDSLIYALKSKINKHLVVFNQLLKDEEIDTAFYDIAKMNVEYMYAERLATAIRSTYQMPQYMQSDSLIRKKLYEVMPKVFEMYPVKGAKMEWLFNFNEYTDLYLTFMEDYKDGVFRPIKRKGDTMFAPIYKKSNEVLSYEVNKYYQLTKTICNTAALVPNSLKLSEEYLKENPELRESWGGKLLEDVLIPNAKDYEKLKEEPMPIDVCILDGKNINSLPELSDILKNQAMLIDCWGTWCAGCRQQFYHMDSIKSLLIEKKMHMVYIAFEYTEDKQKWESIMKAYDLKGYHIIANKNLETDIKSKIGDAMYFPNFMIVDKNGKILEKHAAYASEGKKLYKQIEEQIK